MKRLLSLLLLLAGGALLAGPAQAGTIYIRNISTVVTDTELQEQMPAFQDAFTLDFDPAWGTGTTLTFSPFPPARATVLTVADEDASVPGALGYHDVAKGAIPYGVVFAKTTLDAGSSVSVTIAHELFEMAVNPLTSDAVKVARYYYPFYMQETGDPVEADRFGYFRTAPSGASVLISDFVLPRWFRAGSPGPWDFSRHTTRALQILKGGYQLAWSRISQSWTHVCAAGEVCRHKPLR